MENTKKESKAAPLLDGSKELAVMAPYWLDGVHNHKGIALAKRINEMINKGEPDIISNPQSIQGVMDRYFPQAERLGLHIVTMEQYQADDLLKLNPAEPALLLAGAFTRDNEGAYRPSTGGQVIIQDLGGEVDLVSESHDAYLASIELAKAKGWKPTEQDLARLAKAFADQGGLPEKAQQAVITPATAGLHIGPVVAVDGQFICQKTGRDHKQVTWHDTQKMDGHVPAIGQMAAIKYKNGRDQVVDKAVEQGVSR